MKEKFPLTNIQFIFYFIGWVTGILNLVFWTYQLTAYALDPKRKKFLSNDFHMRVYYWGIISTFMLIMVLAITFLLPESITKPF